MNKLLFVVVLLSACVLRADVNADTITYQALYWQITAEDQATYGASKLYLYAKVDGDKVTIPGTYTDNISATALSGTTPIVGSEGWDWGTYSSVSATFYAELWNDQFETVAQTQAISYDALQKYMDINWGASTAPQKHQGYYTFSFSVPEPTSAVLMLLAVAGLALKRKHLG